MKPSEIVVGATYVNRGKGKTTRTVIAIGDEHRPPQWFGYASTAKNEPGVLFAQGGERCNLYLSSFASWAGKRVEPQQ